jgi:hypothetical protein
MKPSVLRFHLCGLHENAPCSISNSYALESRFGRAKKQGQTAMTIRQLEQRDFVRAAFSAEQHLAMAGDEQRSQCSGKLEAAHKKISCLPPQPDATVLSNSIPLFFIGRNHSGFWVARDAEGRSGGLFLLKRSAVHFARKTSAPGGCATMLVPKPPELDIPNQGSRLVKLLAVALDVVERYLHTPGII